MPSIKIYDLLYNLQNELNSVKRKKTAKILDYLNLSRDTIIYKLHCINCSNHSYRFRKQIYTQVLVDIFGKLWVDDPFSSAPFYKNVKHVSCK